MSAGPDASGETADGEAARRRPRDLDANPFDAPDAAWAITYDSGLVSRPVEASYLPTVTAEDAIRRAAAVGLNTALQPGTPTAVLRSVSVGFEGQDSTYVPHPAWVVIWYGSRPYGQSGSDGRAASPPRADDTAVECLYLVVVDASTGDPQDVRQICRAASC